MPARSSRCSRSSARTPTGIEAGPGSLKPIPMRSYEQTRMVLASSSRAAPELPAPPKPLGSKITVGSPVPMQRRCSRRPPTSISCPAGRYFCASRRTLVTW